jgi:hypothetical protein
MTKIISLLAAIVFTCSMQSKAQNYSNWIADNTHPELKVRYYTGKDQSGYTFVYVQIVSGKSCKLELTASLCGKDGNSKNSWYYTQLFKDKPVTKAFKVLNSCTDGFWWWYRNYKSGAVVID